MKKIILSVLLSTLVLSSYLFADIKFISPIKGNWANKQMLILDNSTGGEYFYSVDGSEPDSFGFAYDGPVLLDVTGDVELKVTCISAEGAKEKTSLKYTVNEDPAKDTVYKDFVQGFYESGILNYSAGSTLSIPSVLTYSMGLPPDSFLPGQDISISAGSVLSRYIPCTVFDSRKMVFYRFIIKTYPQNAGIYSKRDVPFTITDWETVTFTNNNYLYKIDSEYWGLPSAPRKLDRSIRHMISWQSIDYEAGNPIEYFVLPPKPEIISTKNEDGSFVYSIKGDASYTMSVFSEEKNEYMELFPKIGADVFYGDSASGTLDIGVFANSVYQGKIVTDYVINKRPPVKPEIKTTARSFYSRDKVHVDVTAVPGCDLYIALSEPCNIKRSEELYSADSDLLKKIPVGEFKPVKGSKFTINWGAKGSEPAYYKLQAYAVNGNNKSLISEYSIIIDQSSYYFDQKADGELAEGTALHPFTDFDQCVKALKNSRSVTLRVKGELEINKKYFLESNYEFIGDEDACILFGPDASLALKGSSLEIYNFRIKNQMNKNAAASNPLFRLENAVLTMKNCTIGVDFARNGSLIDSYNSIINISDSIAGITAGSYASFISAVKSRLSVKKCSVSTAADTSVIISSSEGNTSLIDNNLLVAGNSGRIAEFFGVKANCSKNTYKAQLKNTTEKVVPVFCNETTKLTGSDNITYGF